MKRISIFTTALTVMLLIVSCKEYDVKMLTIVNSDGTCRREVSYSNQMTKETREKLWNNNVKWSLPLPECLSADSMHTSHTEINADTVTTTFIQIFDSAEEMSSHTPLLMNGVPLKSEAHLKKQFRWFYTDFTFSETFFSLKDSFMLPTTPYADEAAIKYWFTGEPDLAAGLSGAEAAQMIEDIEPKITRWLNDNIYKHLFNYIISNYDAIENPPVTKDEFINMYDSFAAHMSKQNYDAPETIYNYNNLIRDFFNSTAYDIFFDDKTQYGKELEKQLTERMNIFLLKVEYGLQMPGEIISAGEGALHNNGTVIYALTGERLIPDNYTISAVSRERHAWAYVVSIIILLTAAASLIKMRKQRK